MLVHTELPPLRHGAARPVEFLPPVSRLRAPLVGLETPIFGDTTQNHGGEPIPAAPLPGTPEPLP